jgi:protease-4
LQQRRSFTSFIGRFFLLSLASVGAIVIIAACFFSVFFIRLAPNSKDLPQSMVLTFEVSGDLPEYISEDGFFKGFGIDSFSHYKLLRAINIGSSDSRVKGIVININGAMGHAKTFEFVDALRRFKKSGKFVFVFSDNFSDLGLPKYYLASVADEIAMQPYSSIHLMGLGMDMPHIKNFLDLLNIVPNFYKRSEYKSIFDMFTEGGITKENRQALEAMLRSFCDEMIKSISIEREIPASDLFKLINSPPLHGSKKSVDLGLIDKVYYHDQFMLNSLKRAGYGSEHVAIEHYVVDHGIDYDNDYEHVAIIFADGVVDYDNSSGFGVMSNDPVISDSFFEEQVDAVLKNKKVRAVVLRLNTPGGSPIVAESIWRRLQILKQSGLPVVVSMGDYCASAGYWIACGADKIIASPMTITGSIGAAGGKFSLEKLLKHFGIEVDSVKIGDYALMNSPYREFTEKELAAHKESVDYIYYSFLAKVSEGRSLDIAQVESVAKGRPWTGADALKNGLVDGVGGLDQAVDVAANLAKLNADSFVVRPYPEKSRGIFRLSSLIPMLRHYYSRYISVNPTIN